MNAFYLLHVGQKEKTNSVPILYPHYYTQKHIYDALIFLVFSSMILIIFMQDHTQTGFLGSCAQP